MVKLTEDMVVARSKGSDLHNVRKLNCWGSELSDVSVVRKLSNVEVLSLSVNRICTLADFQHCPNLQELYIRKNNIADINEVLYLRQLPKLKSLWLADNPCAEFEQYRLTVLRALPHLQKLDNVAVDSEEVQKAMVCGVPLPSSDPSRGGEEREMPRSSSMGESLRSESGGGSSLSDCSPPASERRYSHTAGNTPTRPSHQVVYDDDDDDDPPVTRRPNSYGSYSATDPERRMSQVSQVSSHGQSPQHQYGGGTRANQLRQRELSSSLGNTQYTRRLPNTQASTGYQGSHTNGVYYRGESDPRERLHRDSYYAATQSPSRRSSQIAAEDPSADSRGYIRSPDSSSCTLTSSNADYDSRNANYLSRDDSRNTQDHRDQRWCEPDERERAYSRGDGYGYVTSPAEMQQPPPGTYDQRTPGQEPRYQSRGDGRSVQQNYDNAHRRAEQHMDTAARSVTSERSSPTKPYPSRPRTRNANLLSAVLCLVKELDYTSLEVVEMAVRCRMEELDD
ncbi:hypothetical protein Pmani_016839 [Petrolisthes manimaculis]|uniref:U2A'/phosphoprotein 32 family A C-terminal domain-containing protein n=1 Tax=Petrolisthes manimaculis TaxID=1843537 RepID=A0AAE1PRE9_9EUCA|nr:hypothetical protein Pmani_016839 [Petrolisthes manimaculis]